MTDELKIDCTEINQEIVVNKNSLHDELEIDCSEINHAQRQVANFLCDVEDLAEGQSIGWHRSERISIDPDKMETIGKIERSQVRIELGNEYALYSTYLLREESPDNIIRMMQQAKERLGTSDPFSGKIRSKVVEENMTETEARTAGELIEKLEDNGTNKGLVVIAPHGGSVEVFTSAQVDRAVSNLAAYNVSNWQAKGYKEGGGAYTRWHITSVDISEHNFPKLNTIINRGFKYCLAIHGFSQSTIIIGGRYNETLKENVRDAIQAVVGAVFTVEIQAEGPYDGNDDHNIINRLATTSVQIEQPYAARNNYGDAIIDAVCSVFAPLL